MRIFAIVSLAAGVALFAANAMAQDTQHGATEYKLCASCHGFQGEGNQLVNAPALGGQEAWYLERQIRNFRDGLRGSVDGDTHGAAMAQMTRGIDSDDKILDIVAYINTLPAADPAPTVDGDKEKGRKSYETCAACHGVNAEGNPALNAPALTTLDDWYQLRQLMAFKSGLRGVHPDDVYGQQMRPMAGVLADDAAMRSVVAYIASIQ